MKKLFQIKTSYITLAIILALPFVTFAQTGGLFKVLATIRTFIAALVPLIIGLAVLYFLWGVLQYVVAKESDAQKEARNIMIMGIIVLFVMVSVWGLVTLLQDTFDIDTSNPINPKLIP